jgi:hypothetical protein
MGYQRFALLMAAVLTTQVMGTVWSSAVPDGGDDPQSVAEVSDVEEQQVQQLPFDLPLVLTPLDGQSDVYVVEQPEDTGADVPIDKRDYKIKIKQSDGEKIKIKIKTEPKYKIKFKLGKK